LVLDGATVTEIQKRGISGSEPALSAVINLESPDVLRSIHADYLEAGSDIITANTFGVSRSELSLIGKGDSWEEYPVAGLEVALNVRDEVKLDALVAVGIHPEGVGETLLERRIQLLAESGVDLILAEGTNTIAECVRFAEASKDVDLPLFIGIGNLAEAGTLRDESSIESLVRALDGYRVDGLFAMDSFPPSISATLPLIKEHFSGFVGVHPHVGMGDTDPEVVIASEVEHSRYYSSEEFSRYAATWRKMGTQIIGGCCGTDASYIAKLAR
jgi:S-methylmethionine-dependent homocysteine/selenocysteine methylase